jgi:hypothetical protein
MSWPECREIARTAEELGYHALREFAGRFFRR